MERCSGLESDLKASEELLQEKLSALAQLQEDSAVLNEQLLAVKEQLSKSVADNTQLQSENNDLQLVVGSMQCSCYYALTMNQYYSLFVEVY